MRVTLVPSSIALDGAVPSQYLISYLINDTIAIDAGSLGLYGSPQRQAATRPSDAASNSLPPSRSGSVIG